MAAGLSKKQIYNRVYNRLEKIKWAVYAKYGVVLRHEKQALYEGPLKVIYYEVGRMSNGETVGLLKNESSYKI